MWKIIISLSTLFAVLNAASGDAKTYRVSSQKCALSANAPIVLAPDGSVIATDLNPGRLAADDVLVIYDSRYDGWASRRLFARFVLDPSTGRAVTAGPPGRAIECVQ